MTVAVADILDRVKEFDVNYGDFHTHDVTALRTALENIQQVFKERRTKTITVKCESDIMLVATRPELEMRTLESELSSVTSKKDMMEGQLRECEKLYDKLRNDFRELVVTARNPPEVEVAMNNLRQEVRNLGKGIPTEGSERVGDRATFAEVAKSVTGSRVKTKNKVVLNEVIIRPQTGGDSDKTRNMVVQSMERLGLENVKVNGIRRIGGGGVIVETKTKEEAERIVSEFAKSDITKEEFSVRKPTRLRPRNILFSVDQTLDAEKIKKDLIAKNGLLKEDNFELILSLKANRGRNWVITIAPALNKSLNKLNGLYLGYQRISFREFISVRQCMNCGSFGHFGKKIYEL